MKELFLLDPNVIFLNHGSFGACPRPVFESYQAWQLELERQPVDFLINQATPLMAEARARLAAYLGAEADEVVYFPNPTTAINMVARSLVRLLNAATPAPGGRKHRLQPGDEILATDHEYGAMDRTWRFICRQNGMRYVNSPVPLPMTNETSFGAESFIETFWKGINPRTRVIFISHVTSPTALTFPVAEICQRARQAGILTIVDGAHAVGYLPLDLKSLGADIYTGACHKWLCAPKGAAFLHVRREIQEWLDPLVVSWGYEADPGFGSGNTFIDYHEWQGTRDLAAFLSVPAAIDFQQQHHWDAIRDRCHHLAVDTRRRINSLTGLPPICPETTHWFGQMFSILLPQEIDLKILKSRLYSEFRIEVPTVLWNDNKMLRVSIQGYNDQADADTLVEALAELLLHKETAP